MGWTPAFAGGSCVRSAEEGLAGAPRSAAPGNWRSNHSACRPCTRWPMMTCEAKPMTDMEANSLAVMHCSPVYGATKKHRTMAANPVSGRDCVPHSLPSRRPTGAVGALPDPGAGMTLPNCISPSDRPHDPPPKAGGSEPKGFRRLFGTFFFAEKGTRAGARNALQSGEKTIIPPPCPAAEWKGGPHASPPGQQHLRPCGGHYRHF